MLFFQLHCRILSSGISSLHCSGSSLAQGSSSACVYWLKQFRKCIDICPGVILSWELLCFFPGALWHVFAGFGWPPFVHLEPLLPRLSCGQQGSVLSKYVILLMPSAIVRSHERLSWDPQVQGMSSSTSPTPLLWVLLLKIAILSPLLKNIVVIWKKINGGDKILPKSILRQIIPAILMYFKEMIFVSTACRRLN